MRIKSLKHIPLDFKYTIMALLQNRTEAAERLLIRLADYLTNETLIYAIPGGGIPIAFVTAKAMAKPIDIVMAKKIGHPINPEYAIGAVSPDSEFINIREGIPDKYIDVQVETIREQLQEKYTYFMGDHQGPEVKDKSVIIFDDGIATGNSMLAAVRVIWEKDPSSVMVATPVISPQALLKIQQVANEVIYLHAPEPFISVGTHYADFPQLTDEEVKNQLYDAYHYAEG